MGGALPQRAASVPSSRGDRVSLGLGVSPVPSVGGRPCSRRERTCPRYATMGGMGIPLAEWSGSAATDRLRETMVELAAKTDRQTRQMLFLTWALVVLTLVIAVLTVVLVVRPSG